MHTMNPDSSSRKKPQRLKERLREATAAAILEAAETVLLEHGLQAPMEVIATRAGVAVGTLYNHFADRKALLDALVASQREQLRTNVQRAQEETADASPREQLLAMLTAMRGAWTRVFLVIRQSEQMPDAKKRAEMRTRVGALFAPVLERARKAGLVAADPDGLQPVILHGLIKTLFVFASDDPKRLPLEAAPALVVDTFFSGVAPKKPRS